MGAKGDLNGDMHTVLCLGIRVAIPWISHLNDYIFASMHVLKETLTFFGLFSTIVFARISSVNPGPNMWL